ncbi:GumC family protein [Microvirga flavescens]|uniref:GumC family protein n=1 Tax=Microvirga flavescens TaxID=2249811 RepID=UPI000DD59C60|nr:Wzz/FepE/Etk N-terminal domain-containing protein [Microvirga flavescens]
MGNIDFRFYRSIFLRRFPYFAAIALTIALIGFIVASMLPPVYRAEAQIMVESPQISMELARSTVPTEIVKQVQLIELQMKTRANLLAIADRFSLYGDRTGLSENDIADDMRARMNFEQIRFETQRASDAATAFAVTFKAKDPVLAAEVVNEFVKLILERNTLQRTQQATETSAFFQQETERLGAKLGQLEREILDFKSNNKDALPESLSFRRTQQIGQQERLTQLSREEASLRDGRSRLTEMFSGTGRVASAAMTPAEQTLQQLRRVLTEQRTIFSEASPGLVALQEQIAALEKAVQAERTGGSEGTTGKAVPTELDLQIADIDRRLALIAEERSTLSQSLTDLNQSIAATPANETALNALERQHQNVQTQYNMAVARLGDASTGQRIEQRAKGERLSVLELATPPQRPIGPKRLAIAGGSVIGGLVLGLAFIVLLEITNKGIRRPAELIETLDIEPLATIPYIPVRGETYPRRLPLIPSTLRRSLRM